MSKKKVNQKSGSSLFTEVLSAEQGNDEADAAIASKGRWRAPAVRRSERQTQPITEVECT